MSESLKRNYSVGEELGRGRFGTVFKCYSPATGEPFAIKSIDKRLIANDAIDRQCLYNEPKIMHLLSPNSYVVRVFDIYEDDNHLDMVLELCNSGDLFQRLSSQPIFSESEAVDVMVLFQITKISLAADHKRGILLFLR